MVLQLLTSPLMRKTVVQTWALKLSGGARSYEDAGCLSKLSISNWCIVSVAIMNGAQADGDY